MASVNSNEARELQQVMGAQDAVTTAPQVNGVDHGPSHGGRLQDAGKVLSVGDPAGVLAGHGQADDLYFGTSEGRHRITEAAGGGPSVAYDRQCGRESSTRNG